MTAIASNIVDDVTVQSAAVTSLAGPTRILLLFSGIPKAEPYTVLQCVYWGVTLGSWSNAGVA